MPNAHRRVQIIAHRGNSCCAPENTLAAIEQAFGQGAEYAEVDVRLSADGVAVLMHDPTLDRTTDGTGWVSETTVRQLKVLDAGSWFDPRYAVEKVPTLEEALELARGRGGLILDIKYAGMAEAIRSGLSQTRSNPETVWVWQGTDPELARELTGKLPVIRTLWDWPPSMDAAMLNSMKMLEVKGFDVRFDLADRTLIQRARAEGMPIFTYTLLDPQSIIGARACLPAGRSPPPPAEPDGASPSRSPPQADCSLSRYPGRCEPEHPVFRRG